MQSEIQARPGRSSTSRAVRRHPLLVAAYLVIGALIGLLYAASQPSTYTATATVLVNPSVGNPFVPTPSAVRQDELTSLETEAQVASSAEVLNGVTKQYGSVTVSALNRNLQIIVPPNSQTLAISYSAHVPAQAQLIANAVANAYLANRAHQFADVNAGRIKRLSAQTSQVVRDLRSATTAAENGDPAKRAFHTQLATALRNQLVNLRAQSTVLENSDAPAGSLISPAVLPQSGVSLTALIPPVAGALAGLTLGCLIALLTDRLSGRIRTSQEVEEIGLPVSTAVPTTRGPQLLRRHRGAAFDTTMRRLRASVLELDPRPDIITVAPPGCGRSDAAVSEAVAESFAKAGHRVVLVRADTQLGDSDDLVVEDGLAQALLYERLNVLELLEPSREPLLCVLPAGGFNAQSREFLSAARLRSVLAPLVEAGNLVVIESPGLDTVEGEAIAGAADLCLVAVTTRRTRTSAVAALVRGIAAKDTPFAALVVGHHDAALRSRLESDDEGSRSEPKAKKIPAPLRSRLIRTKR